MFFTGTSRRADKNLYNSASANYIPIACHYNEHTLLTKNGELLQIIQINGLNSEKISDKLFNLREVLRKAIKNNINSDKFSFWIHTVRRKTNLDDPLGYDKLLSANIHDLWCKKNYWRDKFVNTLYISIVYDAAIVKIKNIDSFSSSLDFKLLQDFQRKYLDNGLKQLELTTNNILSDIAEYGAEKLGIRFEKDEVFSDPLSLYYKIIHLNENNCALPAAELSDAISLNNYTIGGDKIEVISDDEKKFTTILSIKEYQDLAAEYIDQVLQLPLEIIATEVFYFISNEHITPLFKDQNYILRVSGDEEAKNAIGLERFNPKTNESKWKFCMQQISLMVISDNITKLENDTKRLSVALSDIGIVHVKEDINLEQSFWAQLPANFSYLRRMSPTIIDDTAALASLHNFPTGDQYSRWGKAVTILRTEKGTPYFMNLHDKNQQAKFFILGDEESGKTTLMNFLISESTKFNPSILYVATSDNSKIFIEGLEGKWSDQATSIINPFLCEDGPVSREFFQEFFKIICGHYFTPLSDAEQKYINEIIDYIFTLPFEERLISAILNHMQQKKQASEGKESGSTEESIDIKLSCLKEGGKFFGLFEAPSSRNADLQEGNILGLNLHKLTAKYFSSKFGPSDPKNTELENGIKQHRNICFAVIYAACHYLSANDDNPKILALDNAELLIDFAAFFEPLISMINDLAARNSALIANINLNYLVEQKKEVKDKINKMIDTKIILPFEAEIEHLDELFDLTKQEIAKLLKLQIQSRAFLIKQNNSSVIAEFSIGGITALLKILSSDEEDRKIYQNILEQHAGHPDNWIGPLYEALNKRF